MRSPPMRHASLHLEGIPPTEPHDRRRASSPQTLPQFVADDIVRADLKGLYWNVQDDRDRRVRLLIRRYVNQIQHGCLNRNCNVSTCLSYRKRNSKVPLRNYTDLSARSLACRLVDDYAQSGKDPSCGLCQSKPVVPWYDHPKTRSLRNRSSKNSKRFASENCNGHAPEDPPHPSSTRDESRTAQSKRIGGEHCEQIYDEGDGKSGAKNVSAGQAYANGAGSPRDETKRTERFGRSHESGKGDTAEPGAEPPTAAHRKDLSSFVQCLYDTISLRNLELSTRPPPDATKAPTTDHLEPGVQQGEDIEITTDTLLELEDPKPGLDLTNTAFCGFTLRKLSWKTLTWLVDVRNESPELQGTPFEMFLKQSLYHSLSNPDRLHESAQSWNHDGDEGHKQEHKSDEDRNDIVQDKASKSCSGLHEIYTRETPVHDEDEAQKPARVIDIHTGRTSICYEADEPHSSTKQESHGRAGSVLRKFDINRNLEAFDILATLNDGTDEVYSALHTALQQCYTVGLPRPTSKSRKLRLKSLKRSGGGMKRIEDTLEIQSTQSLSKAQVSEIFLSILLASLMPLFSEDLADAGFDPIILGSVADMRNDHRAYPVVVFGSVRKNTDDVQLRQLLIDIIDHFEDWHLLRLTSSLMDCLSHHLAAAQIRRNQNLSMMGKVPRNVLEIMLDRLCGGLHAVDSAREIDFRAILGLGIIELARSVLLKEWNREPVIRRTGAVGGALELLAAVYRRNASFYIGHSLFYMPFVALAFDEMDMPVHWQSFRPNGKEIHILSFSFLFEPATLVKYFRAVNVNAMRKAHESASAYSTDARQFLGNTVIPVYGGKEVLAAMRPHMAKYLVLTIRRSNVLEDAINQLWRRQRREILRPLRVRLGKDEGEDGLDHGGVQQEFFRLVFAEAFRPEYGMFTVDSSTRMTWFQPGSLEPLYKFEALGILMSLAVYNAVTLPITFPLAFYRKLLGLKVKKLDHIRDGWPELAKGLKILLDFDGDVAETISRTYEFSYEFSGSMVNIDMQKHGRDDPWPPVERPSRKGKEKAKSTSFELPVQLDITPPSQSPLVGPLSRTSSVKGISTPLSLESEVMEDAPTVTNETREQYVKDYLFWLADKSIRPQFEAFAKGFFTCLDQTALSMFTPEALREVMEGHRNIDINELERTATYEDYEKTSEYICQFWQVVRDFSPEQHRNLLEFVTASDRVPVNGLESIHFIVQKNGDDDARLPSSSTCYGRLLLPQYSSKEILVNKLSKALENSQGFGVV